MIRIDFVSLKPRKSCYKILYLVVSSILLVLLLLNVYKCKHSLFHPFLQTFKLFEKLAVQDREKAMKLAEEARAVPAVVEEIEVQSQPEPAQESTSAEVSSTEPVPAGAASADGNDAKVQPAESEQPTAAPASAPSASAVPASAPAASSDSSAAAS